MIMIIYSRTGPKFFNNNCICCNSYKNFSSQGGDIQVWNKSNEKVNFESPTILITCNGENSKETHKGREMWKLATKEALNLAGVLPKVFQKILKDL